MKYCILIILLLLSRPVFADIDKFERRGTVLVYNSNVSEYEDENQITLSDVQLFKAYIEDKRPWKKVWTIRLTSQGGSEQAGYLISEIILKHKLDTQASGICASACTDIFLAGKKRRLMKGAELVFHPHYLSGNNNEENRKMFKKHFPDLDFIEAVTYNERLGAADMMATHSELGIDLGFSLRVLQIHPNKEWIPSRSELIKYGILN